MAGRSGTLIKRIGIVLLGAVGAIVFANVCAYVYLKPALPDVSSLRDLQLQVPLRIYTRDGKLIAAIGDQRRIPVRYDQLPKKLIQAFIATEDDRFFEHHGVDLHGVVRAAMTNLKAGGIRQGASTITMQVSRDMFLSPRRDMKRKISEIYISLLMEAEFTKEEIFTLYVNKIFLGQRAYGVGAAAEVYFGKSLDELSLAEMATLAGLPAAPSVVNPVANVEAAKVRRTHVLGRMRDLHYITAAEFREANSSPMESHLHGPTVEVEAPYVAEMVRNEMQSKYGDGVYAAGYRVYTTIDSRLERAAVVALRTGLLEYDRYQGWRGATAKVDVSALSSTAKLDAELGEFPVIGGLRPAIVQSADEKTAKIYRQDLGSVVLPWEKWAWARRQWTDDKTDRGPTAASEVLSPGDVIYTVGNSVASLQLVQVPQVQGALVSLDPKDGAVVALVGGFDFSQSKFNRVTQARRQPGSGFKPFVYAAAFAKGYTAASVISDAPIILDETDTQQGWRPKNSHAGFSGPVRLREALALSLNLVSVRLMRAIGVDYSWKYVQRFGFDKSQVPRDLSMALGTASLSPLQVANGYATFANGGFKVTPYYIDRIEDGSGKTVMQAEPAIACFECGRVIDQGPSARTGSTVRPPLLDEGAHDGVILIPQQNLAPQVISPQIAYLLSDMMKDVIKRGTATRARALNRDDVAGKTGTTNDHRDAWFNGFNGDLVTTVWTGFDQDRSLGDGEDGGRVSVPIWTYFMREALAGAPRHDVPLPDGIVTARISRETGLLASADDPDGMPELFMEGHLPKTEIYEAPDKQGEGDKPLF